MVPVGDAGGTVDDGGRPAFALCATAWHAITVDDWDPGDGVFRLANGERHHSPARIAGETC